MAGELILIVEDNEQNLKLVRDVLAVPRLPHARGARRGEEGVALAGAHRPDLVLHGHPAARAWTASQALARLRGRRRGPRRSRWSR